VASIEDNNE